MIIVYGRKLIIPKIDSIIGWQGDNLVETRSFELERYYNNIDLSLLDFKIDILSGETTNIIDLDKDISIPEKVTLTWTVQEAHLVNEGLAKIQVRGLNGTLVKWHSDIEYIIIKKSINASEIYLNPLPTEFDEMEVRITAAKNTATELKDTALTAAAAALLSETNAKASEDAALLSKTNAQTAEANAAATLNEFLEKANSIFNVSTAQPTYGLWIEEVI